MRKVVRDLGMTWKKGKLLLARAPTEAREKLVTKIKSLLRAAHAGKEKLIFIDEAHVHQDADLGHTWSRRGQRYYVASTSPDQVLVLRASRSLEPTFTTTGKSASGPRHVVTH